MITNFEELTEPLNEKEMQLEPYVIKVLKNLIGKENIAKNDDVCDRINMFVVMENGAINQIPHMNGRLLRRFVNHFRSNGQLPVIATSQGYYVSYNKNEIASQIKSMNERANGILAAAKGLEKFI